MPSLDSSNAGDPEGGWVVFPELTGEPPKPAFPVPWVAAGPPLLQSKLKYMCHLTP